MSERKEFDHSEDHAGIGLPSLHLAKTRTTSLSLSLWDYQATDEERTSHKKAKINDDKFMTGKDRVQECDHNNSNDHDLNNVEIGLPSAVHSRWRSLSLSLWDYQTTNEARPALEGIKIKENTIKREDQVLQEYDQNNSSDHDNENRNSDTTTSTTTIPSVLGPANYRRPLSLSLSLWDYDNDHDDGDENRNNGSAAAPSETESEVVALAPQLANHSLPWELKSKIEKMGGGAIKMVIQKQLFKSDVNSTNGRFSIPEMQIEEEARDFLTQEEVELLERREGNNKAVGMRVMVIDPELEEHNDVILKKWEMKVSSVYNLIHRWNAIVQNNNLNVGDTVQLWSFRSSTHQLCFALVKL